jgi:hypothetical protein
MLLREGGLFGKPESMITDGSLPFEERARRNHWTFNGKPPKVAGLRISLFDAIIVA